MDNNDETSGLLDNFNIPKTEFEVIKSTQLTCEENEKNKKMEIIIWTLLVLLGIIVIIAVITPMVIGIKLLIINSNKFFWLGSILIVGPPFIIICIFYFCRCDCC